MAEYKDIIRSNSIISLIKRTLNYVDTRLVDHGIRVAFSVFQMLKAKGETNQKYIRDVCFLSMMHDIGAYKTEEINRMVEFETNDVWDHSIYGYLFIKYYSPLKDLAPAILYHHLDYEKLIEIQDITEESKEIAQIIFLADRADIFFSETGRDRGQFNEYLGKRSGRQFSKDVIDLYLKSGISLSEKSESVRNSEFEELLDSTEFTRDETDSYIEMLIFTIDFRSYHTVCHTMTTTSISHTVAELLQLPAQVIREVTYGALLHDLGKIGVPVEILEFPGKLSPQAMNVMRTHVDMTEKILGDSVSEEVKQIALRHHEKLNGKGYPRGLTGDELNVAQRLVGVADIISALCGTRSYKEAFSDDKTIQIISGMSKNGLIDTPITTLIIDNFDYLMKKVKDETKSVLDSYVAIHEEYEDWKVKLL